jgi:RHS repeat-associated protein
VTTVPHLILSYNYDAVGNIIEVSDNYGVRVDSTWDARNLLTSRTWQGGGVSGVREDFQYNPNGQVTEQDRFSDLAGTQLIGKTLNDYDIRGRLIETDQRDATDTLFAKYQWTLDPVGLLLSETYNGQSSNFGYDPTNQLTSATYSAYPNENFAYDPTGNRNSAGYVPGPNNQILSDGTFNYAYDANGNLIRKTEIATGNYTVYIYDFRNRLVEVDQKTASGIILHVSKYTYDVFDQRIAVSVDSVTTATAYDGQSAWADFNGAGAVVARYLAGAKIDQMLARFRPGEGVSWYLTDRLGSVRDLVNAAGQLINHIDYSAFGAVLRQTNAGVGDRFLFTGREFDTQTGLYYYRARYYDAGLGRFISADPSDFLAGDINLYRYVHNEPFRFIDPFGLATAGEYNVALGTRQAALNVAFQRFGQLVCTAILGTALTAVIATGAPFFGVTPPPGEAEAIGFVTAAVVCQAIASGGYFSLYPKGPSPLPPTNGGGGFTPSGGWPPKPWWRPPTTSPIIPG